MSAKTTTKRLDSSKKKKKKKRKRYKRRNNQFPKTPPGMDHITTPSPDKASSDNQEHENKEPDENKEQEMDFGAKYEYVSFIGAGAFGKVVKVKNKQKKHEKGEKPEFFAIKIVPNIFSSSTKAKRFLRELRILRLLSKHESIIELIDLIPPQKPLKFSKLSLVFEFMPTDLKKILKSSQFFSSLHIQYVIYQVMLGLKFIHTAGIVHRDLKPENITINEYCSVRIIDFGLARGVAENFEMKQKDIQSESAQILGVDPSKEEEEKEKDGKKKVQNALTKHVVTRWYRSPEVILLQQDRETIYSLDVWSIGCIFGELLQMNAKNCANHKKRRVLFPGRTCFPFSTRDPFDYQHRTDQLRTVFDLIGTPSDGEIKYFKDANVRMYLSNMKKSKAKDLSKLFPATKKTGIKLLSDMLHFDVKKRISMEDALKSSYFDDVRDDGVAQRHLKIEKFEFEDTFIDEKILRALILDEVIYFNHEWKKQLKEEVAKKAKELNMQETDLKLNV